MSREHNFVGFVKKFALITGSIYVFNKVYSTYAVKKHLLSASSENFFEWKGLNIYFKKIGEGSPIILLHAIHPASSSYEWSMIEDKLAESHTVYSIDLPGCGRSSKPKLQYTNFFYVTLLKDFIHSQDLHDVTVVASNLSSAIPIMASAYDETLIKNTVLINPTSRNILAKTPDYYTRFLMWIMNLPIIGTLIYNIQSSRSNIDLAFTEKYFYNPFNDTDELVDTFFESAHLASGNGQYLAGSMYGNFLNINVDYALSNMTIPVKIIEGDSLQDADEIARSWKALYKEISISTIHHTKQLPHLEEPEIVAKEIFDFCR